MQQTQHDPQPLRAALSTHLLSPSVGLRSEQAAAVRQIQVFAGGIAASRERITVFPESN